MLTLCSYGSPHRDVTCSDPLSPQRYMEQNQVEFLECMWSEPCFHIQKYCSELSRLELGPPSSAALSFERSLAEFPAYTCFCKCYFLVAILEKHIQKRQYIVETRRLLSPSHIPLPRHFEYHLRMKLARPGRWVNINSLLECVGEPRA